MAAAQQEEKNWNPLTGRQGAGRLQILVQRFTEAQCKEVVQLLHSMHKGFDGIIKKRAVLGTFRDKTRSSFLYNLTLYNYLEKNSAVPQKKSDICDLVIDRPGRLNASNGLLGWYLEENVAPVLCEVVSPWNETRQTMITELDSRQGKHWARFQLKAWAVKYKENWAKAQLYEDWANTAKQALLPNKKPNQKQIKTKIKQLLPDWSNVLETNSAGEIVAKGFPFLPSSLKGSPEYDSRDRFTWTSIAELLYAANILLWDEGEDAMVDDSLTSAQELAKMSDIVKAVVDKSIQKTKEKFSGSDSTPPANMILWLQGNLLNVQANDWMCGEQCFNLEFGSGKKMDGNGCDTGDDMWNVSEFPIIIQELTDPKAAEFGFSMLGKEIRLDTPEKLSKFYILPKSDDMAMQNYILLDGIEKDNAVFGIDGDDVGNTFTDEQGDEINFNDQVQWRRYFQGTIRDSYDKYGKDPDEQFVVESAAIQGVAAGASSFYQPTRNPTPAIKNGKNKAAAKSGLVCAICCRRPKQTSVKDKWPAKLNPNMFSDSMQKAKREKLQKSLAQEYDVDHIANLIFNELLDLNNSGLGFLNTCAGCNRHLKGEKLWSPSYDLWNILLIKAKLDPTVYTWPGENSPGLIQKPFEGYRVYTIKAFYTKPAEKRYLKKIQNDKNITPRDKAALLKAYQDGQGVNAAQSSSKDKALSIEPEDLEGIILDRYIRTIDKEKRSLDRNNLIIRILEATGANANAGEHVVTDKYEELVGNFPVVAQFETQLLNIDRAIQNLRAPGGRLDMETEQQLAANVFYASPSGSRQSSQGDGSPQSISRQSSMDLSPFGSQTISRTNSEVIVQTPGQLQQVLEDRRRQQFARAVETRKGLGATNLLRQGSLGGPLGMKHMAFVQGGETLPFQTGIGPGRPFASRKRTRRHVQMWRKSQFRWKMSGEIQRLHESQHGWISREPELFAQNPPGKTGGLLETLPTLGVWMDSTSTAESLLVNDDTSKIRYWVSVSKEKNEQGQGTILAKIAEYILKNVALLAGRWEPHFSQQTVNACNLEWQMTRTLWIKTYEELLKTINEYQKAKEQYKEILVKMRDSGATPEQIKQQEKIINSLRNSSRTQMRKFKKAKIQGTTIKIARLIIDKICLIKKQETINATQRRRLQFAQADKKVSTRSRRGSSDMGSGSGSGSGSSGAAIFGGDVCTCNLPDISSYFTQNIWNQSAFTSKFSQRLNGSYTTRQIRGNAREDIHTNGNDATSMAIREDNYQFAFLIFKLREDWVNDGINIHNAYGDGGEGGPQVRPNDMNVNSPDVGGNDASITDGLNRIDFLMTEDIKRKDTYTPLADSTMSGIQYPRLLAKVIHWWSGRLVLDALKTYCPIGNWEAEVVVHGRPTHIRNGYGNVQILIQLENVHWVVKYRPNQQGATFTEQERQVPEGEVGVHRTGGDCGPSAVIWAIVIFSRYNENCWGSATVTPDGNVIAPTSVQNLIVRDLLRRLDNC
jgi:hypothetical protein